MEDSSVISRQKPKDDVEVSAVQHNETPRATVPTEPPKKTKDDMSKFRLLDGVLAFIFGGLFFTMFLFGLTEGNNLIIPSNFDVPLSAVAFGISTLSVCASGLFVQSDVLAPSQCSLAKKVSLVASLSVFIYWIVALITLVKDIKWRYTWVTFAPVLIHFAFLRSDKLMLSKKQQRIEMLKSASTASVGVSSPLAESFTA
ncbi:uncharacterized protein MONOS_8320 [Monocercomonoides exilis]|uniref:uncharacterized protein n=1 Tax=Monocercomonoides exilis TaxID=2049356 RepID=UPI0035598D02|nr:hypothetical protein MONOS_8320 [Monocercomonoides exilis]|eukprot:MONOS_8320.1-p1 / transcript=MONOS_8320.1 / gene=MONOS_8320 / organism=Monocercomonoides_exilis_PA203 / gene_product=unspecified product / transcript_product=unspecified product / location=Mono_scaffold00311:49449-50250(+) / protein_length=200 / sequence_SO=supercontig / SO=protein_coding / is_pseudo=false